MGWRERIKNLLLEEDPKSRPVTVEATSGASGAKGVSSGSVHGAPKGVLEESYVKELRDEAQSGTSKGYRDFRTQLGVLARVIPDEKQRFKAAFIATDAARDISMSDVLSAIDEQRSSLTQARQEFEQELEQKRLHDVEGRAQELKTLAESEERLSVQLAELRTRKDSLVESIKASQSGIEQARANFEAAIVAVTEELEAEHNKVKLYLSEEEES